jgi:DNA-binding transcriptional MerR regulator
MTRHPTSADDNVPAAATGGRVVAIKPYAIGTAARLANIPPETLRIWERRYELLAPGRTEGGHRLYSEDDVTLLKAVKRLVDDGMRIGTIVRLGRDGILEEAERLGPVGATSPVGQRAPSLIDEIVDAARSLDERRVGHLLDRPLLVTDGSEVVHAVYLPLMKHVGELWHAGQLPIAVEHFVEKMVTARVLSVLQATPQPAGGRLALCVCPPDERHEVGLFAAALALKTNGFVVTILGADLPAADLVMSIETTMPAIVVMAVTNPLSAQAAATLVPVLQDGPARRVPLLVGGVNAASLTSKLSREHVAVVERLEDVVDVARRLAG